MAVTGSDAVALLRPRLGWHPFAGCVARWLRLDGAGDAGKSVLAVSTHLSLIACTRMESMLNRTVRTHRLSPQE